MKNVEFLSGSRDPHGPDLPSPCWRKFEFQFGSKLPDDGRRISPKNNMIQDMINSNNMNSTEATIPNIFKIKFLEKRQEFREHLGPFVVTIY